MTASSQLNLLTFVALEHLRRRLSWRKWLRTSGIAYVERLHSALELEWLRANSQFSLIGDNEDSVRALLDVRLLTQCLLTLDRSSSLADTPENRSRVDLALRDFYEQYRQLPDREKFVLWYLYSLTTVTGQIAQILQTFARRDSTPDWLLQSVEQFKQTYFRLSFTMDASMRAIDDSSLWYFARTLFLGENAGVQIAINEPLRLLEYRTWSRRTVAGPTLHGDRMRVDGSGTIVETDHAFSAVALESVDVNAPASSSGARDRETQENLMHRFYLRLAMLLNAPAPSSAANAELTMLETARLAFDVVQKLPYAALASLLGTPVSSFVVRSRGLVSPFRASPDKTFTRSANELLPSPSKLITTERLLQHVSLSMLHTIDRFDWRVSWRYKTLRHGYTRLAPVANAIQLALRRGQPGLNGSLNGLVTDPYEPQFELIDDYRATPLSRKHRSNGLLTLLRSIDRSKVYKRENNDYAAENEMSENDEDSDDSDITAATTTTTTTTTTTLIDSIAESYRREKREKARGNNAGKPKFATVLVTNALIEPCEPCVASIASFYLMHEQRPELLSVFVRPDQDPAIASVLDVRNDSQAELTGGSDDRCLRWVLCVLGKHGNESISEIASPVSLIAILQQIRQTLPNYRFRVDPYMSMYTAPIAREAPSPLPSPSPSASPSASPTQPPQRYSKQVKWRRGESLARICRAHADGVVLLGRPITGQYAPADSRVFWQTECGMIPWSLDRADLLSWKCYSVKPVDEISRLGTEQVACVLQHSRAVGWYALIDRAEIARFLHGLTVNALSRECVGVAPIVRIVDEPLPFVVRRIAGKRIFALEDGTVFVSRRPLQLDRSHAWMNVRAGKYYDEAGSVNPLAETTRRVNDCFARGSLLGSEIWFPLRVDRLDGRCFKDVPKGIAPLVDWLDGRLANA